LFIWGKFLLDRHRTPHNGLGCAGSGLICNFGGAGLTCSQQVRAQSRRIAPASRSRQRNVVPAQCAH
jgi:hypothetical protein